MATLLNEMNVCASLVGEGRNYRRSVRALRHRHPPPLRAVATNARVIAFDELRDEVSRFEHVQQHVGLLAHVKFEEIAPNLFARGVDNRVRTVLGAGRRPETRAALLSSPRACK